jgi:hypothetical protein
MVLRIVLSGVCFASLAWGACTREFLTGITDAYVSAQTKGANATIAALLAPSGKYTENAQPVSLASSTLAYPLKIDFSRSIHDTAECRTFTEIIAATDPHPHVIHTRMELDAASGRATWIESVVTDRGDWAFDAAGTLALNAAEGGAAGAWAPVPEAERDPRDVLKAVGDAYFDRFGNVSVEVPWWGAPCVRVEGGLPARGTVRGEECVMVWPSTIVVPYRRYVVDEVMGAVDLFVGFPGLDRSQGQDPMPDSHLFRVEKGKIKYCHTASACVEAGCGM